MIDDLIAKQTELADMIGEILDTNPMDPALTDLMAKYDDTVVELLHHYSVEGPAAAIDQLEYAGYVLIHKNVTGKPGGSVTYKVMVDFMEKNNGVINAA